MTEPLTGGGRMEAAVGDGTAGKPFGNDGGDTGECSVFGTRTAERACGDGFNCASGGGAREQRRDGHRGTDPVTLLATPASAGAAHLRALGSIGTIQFEFRGLNIDLGTVIHRSRSASVKAGETL